MAIALIAGVVLLHQRPGADEDSVAELAVQRTDPLPCERAMVVVPGGQHAASHQIRALMGRWR